MTYLCLLSDHNDDDERVCVFLQFILLYTHTHLGFSWTRDNRRAHINVYIHYTLCVREEFILFIFCFLILILNIYTVKNHFYYIYVDIFYRYILTCYKCFFYYYFFIFFYTQLKFL